MSLHPVSTVALAVLLAFVLRSGIDEPEWNYKYDPSAERERKPGHVRFLGGDGATWLTGRFHHPDPDPSAETVTPSPVIVLAQGLGLSHDCSLDSFVKAFTSAGFAAFTFDYATFGASDGVPRHQVNPSMHISDIQAAIETIKEKGRVRELNVDVTRLALWGTSLGGGHVLVVASKDPSIKAVVAQIPALASGAESVVGTLMKDPIPTSLGIGNFLLSIAKWAIWNVVFSKPSYLPLHGLPGSAALMQNPGDDEGYASLLPPNGGEFGWKNAATGGSGLHLLTYRPLNSASSIESPTLLIAAEHDTLCPANYIKQAAGMINDAELLVLPGVGHFDVYSGEVLQQMLTTTVDFFKKHLN
jgi:pimeloyl-ACP methyl ester carboxylesterase